MFIGFVVLSWLFAEMHFSVTIEPNIFCKNKNSNCISFLAMAAGHNFIGDKILAPKTAFYKTLASLRIQQAIVKSASSAQSARIHGIRDHRLRI